MTETTVEARAAAEAMARLAAKHSREYQRLYAQCAHPQNAAGLEEIQPLKDMNGREILPGLRVKRPDGMLGRVKKLNVPRRAAIVIGDDGTERFVMAHRLKVTSPKKENATAAA